MPDNLSVLKPSAAKDRGESVMRNEIEQVYLASCPFCKYHEMFSSELMLVKVYDAHLRCHKKEGVTDGNSKPEMAQHRMRNVAEHVQRLEAARYN